MTGVPVTRPNPRDHVGPSLVFDRPERLQGSDGVGLRVDGTDLGPSTRGVASVEGYDLGFLNASGVGQHIGTQIDGAARGENSALEALPDQLWQKPAVIDVGMRQKHCVDIGRPKRKSAVVQFLE